ncbi:DUF6123 family protein [Pontibacillus salicampi]|uniref:DUF6123 family protein n=1 Tax=Pontibacillus salicampi TaxID=1449801 RepID=A0ABV6LLF2_9BACI
MSQADQLGFFIEDLWTKGFKLTDRDVHFIYFGKNYTNAPDWLVIFAVKVTLQIQRKFDESFFIGVLEYIQQQRPKTKQQAWKALERKGISKQKTPLLHE